MLHSRGVVEHVTRTGQAAIRSGSDVLFQPRKIERSRLFKAVEGNLLMSLQNGEELV